jgi:tRNA-specific 2-thiouridylase
VPDNDYRRFLRRYAPEAFEPGPILDGGGRAIGQHKGLANYTIGQRGGIGIAAPEALYVLRMDVSSNALVVGTKHELGGAELIAEDVRWVSGSPPDRSVSASVKIRYRARLAEAQIDPLPGARARVRLFQPLRDITPGQGIVFYARDVVLGGGLITR